MKVVSEPQVDARVCVVTVQGDIDASTAPDLRHELETAVGQGCVNLVIDLIEGSLHGQREEGNDLAHQHEILGSELPWIWRSDVHRADGYALVSQWGDQERSGAAQ